MEVIICSDEQAVGRIAADRIAVAIAALAPAAAARRAPAVPPARSELSACLGDLPDGRELRREPAGRLTAGHYAALRGHAELLVQLRGLHSNK